MNGDYCRRCDVFVGYGAAGVALASDEHASDQEWLASHCWVCGRSREEIRAEQAAARNCRLPPAPASFRFETDGASWKGQPYVGGHAVGGVSGFDVRLRFDEVPAVMLELAAHEGLVLSLAHADVKVGAETREALISMGWTPPPADESGTEAVAP